MKFLTNSSKTRRTFCESRYNPGPVFIIIASHLRSSINNWLQILRSSGQDSSEQFSAEQLCALFPPFLLTNDHLHKLYLSFFQGFFLCRKFLNKWLKGHTWTPAVRNETRSPVKSRLSITLNMERAICFRFGNAIYVLYACKRITGEAKADATYLLLSSRTRRRDNETYFSALALSLVRGCERGQMAAAV